MAEARHHAPTSIPQDQASVRCAVYIRVNIGAPWSAESARMQREAAQAFLENRAVDGWTCSGTYEDIGYSGGTLERPGLQRLLTEINAGTVDCIIVHTLDRLSRMDDDFGKIVMLPRLYDVKVVALYPKPFVAVSSLKSLRESTARTKPSTMDYAHEIKRMHDAGWGCKKIARIAERDEEYIRKCARLAEKGEDRLSDAAHVPHIGSPGPGK